MKKSIFIILALLFLLTACSKEDEARVSLNQIPDDYSLEAAKSDRCVVFEDGDITFGQSEWNSFIKNTAKDKSSTVRLGFYYTLGDPSRYSKELYEEIKDDYPVLFISDLSYDGKEYIIESIEDDQLISKEYKYLMKYKGKPRSASALYSEYTYYVLVNDNTVTWEDLEHGIISSYSGDYIAYHLVYSDLVMK